MKIILVLSLIFIISKKINCQINYVEYHKEISKIEELILNNKYDESLKKYDSLFQKYSNVFSKDLYNAAICSIYLKEFSVAKKYLIQLSHFGIQQKILKKKVFKPLKKDENWRGFNKKYRNHLDSVILLSYQDNDIIDLKNIVKKFNINKKDTSNLNLFIRYLEKKGLPSETKILILKKPNELSFLDEILFHAYQFNSSLMTALLLEQIKKGLIHPYVLASLIDENNRKIHKSPIYGTLVFSIIKKNFYSSAEICHYTKDNQPIFSQNRQLLGLDNCKSYILKIKDKTPFIFSTYAAIQFKRTSIKYPKHFVIHTKNGMFVFF